MPRSLPGKQSSSMAVSIGSVRNHAPGCEAARSLHEFLGFRKRRCDDEQLEENEQNRVFGFKACHVWDISQTEGADLPKLVCDRER